jgi:hypothetical protein
MVGRDPLLEVDGHRVWFRDKDGGYLRLVLSCSSCADDVVWRGPQLRSWDDLDAIDPPPVTCRSCGRDRAGAQPAAVRATYARDQLRVRESS